MQIKVGDRTIPVTPPTSLSLLDLLNLERETRSIGRPITLAVVQGMERDIEEAAAKFTTTAEQNRCREEHPDGQWLLAVLLWSSMRGAGDVVTFSEAISVPVADIDFVKEVGDEPAEQDRPTSAPPASGRGAKPLARSTAKRTSARRSTPA